MDWKAMLWDWRFILACVLGIAIYMVADWNGFKIKLHQLMLDAKSMAKAEVLKSGKDQENWVVDNLYEIMPAKLKLFISKELLRKIVYKAYHTAKDLIDDGSLNNSVPTDDAQ
jgi:hypothetical protein